MWNCSFSFSADCALVTDDWITNKVLIYYADDASAATYAGTNRMYVSLRRNYQKRVADLKESHEDGDTSITVVKSYMTSMDEECRATGMPRDVRAMYHWCRKEIS